MCVLDTLPPEFWRGYQCATFPAGSWGCEAGMLRTVAEAEPIDPPARQQYRHFELTLEWRVARGGKVASSLASQKRCRTRGRVVWKCRCSTCHHPDSQTPETAAGALYGLIAPRRTVLQPIGSFHTARVVVRASPGTVAQWSAGRGVFPAEPRLGSAGGS